MLIVEAVFSLSFVLGTRGRPVRFDRNYMLSCIIHHFIEEDLSFLRIFAANGLNQFVLHGRNEHIAVHLILVLVWLILTVLHDERVSLDLTHP